jgi:hypothetical protein
MSTVTRLGRLVCVWAFRAIDDAVIYICRAFPRPRVLFRAWPIQGLQLACTNPAAPLKWPPMGDYYRELLHCPQFLNLLSTRPEKQNG